MELNHSRDHSAQVAVVAIHELVANILAPLPERSLDWEFFDASIQVLLCHPAIQRELAPNCAIQRQCSANVFAIQRHGQLRSENTEMCVDARSVRMNSGNFLKEARA